MANPHRAERDVDGATELHDLHDEELQAYALADEVWVTMRNEPLAQRVSEFAELRARFATLDQLLQQAQVSARERPDAVMHALARHASEMAEVVVMTSATSRLVAALQRIIHCLSADYATLTMHAAAVGRVAEANQFAQYAENNQACESELNALANAAAFLADAGARHRRFSPENCRGPDRAQNREARLSVEVRRPRWRQNECASWRLPHQ